MNTEGEKYLKTILEKLIGLNSNMIIHRCIIFIKYIIRYIKYLRNSILLNLNPIIVNVMTIDETIEKILKYKTSIVRFGDGEVEYLHYGRNIVYQKYDEKLAQYLKKILVLNEPNFLVCLPDMDRLH